MKTDFLFLKANRRLHKITVSGIVYIEALDDYIRIHFKNGKTFVTRMTMAGMMKDLPAGLFMRVHRSYIVAFELIEAIAPKHVIVNGTEIPLGKQHSAEITTAVKKQKK